MAAAGVVAVVGWDRRAVGRLGVELAGLRRNSNRSIRDYGAREV